MAGLARACFPTAAAAAYQNSDQKESIVQMLRTLGKRRTKSLISTIET